MEEVVTTGRASMRDVITDGSQETKSRQKGLEPSGNRKQSLSNSS